MITFCNNVKNIVSPTSSDSLSQHPSQASKVMFVLVQRPLSQHSTHVYLGYPAIHTTHSVLPLRLFQSHCLCDSINL